MTRVETYPTLAEAARALGSGSAYLAGGTLVMRAVNAGTAPERILRTTDPGLGAIRIAGDTVTLGAGVTMAQVLAERELAFLHPAARAVGGPQVRVMATVGGNLFAPSPYGDFAAALLALGARVTMAGGSGTRPIDDLLRERGRSPGLVATIEVTRPRPGSFGFLKVQRVHPRGAAVMSLAALLPREGGRVRGARMAWGAMGAGPMRGAAVERVLEGQPLDAGSIGRAAQVAAEGLEPQTDSLATAWYRREVAGAHLRRLLETMERG
jgi:CO/xanthine dehydrogenase FAD-binding subunit